MDEETTTTLYRGRVNTPVMLLIIPCCTGKTVIIPYLGYPKEKWINTVFYSYSNCKCNCVCVYTGVVCMHPNLLIIFDRQSPTSPLLLAVLHVSETCPCIYILFSHSIFSCLSLSEQKIIITYFPLSLCLSPSPCFCSQISWPLGNLGWWSDLALTAIFLCSEIKRKRAVWRMLCGICTYWTCYQRESSLKLHSLSHWPSYFFSLSLSVSFRALHLVWL